VRYVGLGKTGVSVSVIALGTWQFGAREWGFGTNYGVSDCVDALTASVEAGVNLVDTAEIYGGGLSEKIVGEAVRQVGREVLVASKVFPHHFTYDGVMKACRRSLERLGLKTIDLYQLHFPNPVIPIRWTMRAMEDLVKEGKIRYIGVSNFSVKRLKEAQEALKREEIVSNQVRYNLLDRKIEKDLVPYCRKEGITILAYSPLAQGVLTGKYHKTTPGNLVRLFGGAFSRSFLMRVEPLLQELEKTAATHGGTIAQSALAWITSREGVVAIAGAKNKVQALENAAAGDIVLTPDEVERLSKISESIGKVYFTDRLARFFGR
jgi:aryl-alcohol dehydrogenase-like predicted oxidoreductase